MKEKSRIIISDSLIADVRSIIEKGRRHAFAVAGQTAIMTYWNVGRRIVEEEQQGNSRASYGKGLIPALADKLAIEYGPGYGRRNLAYYRKFYLMFSDWEILHTRVQNLNWSHIRRILSVSNPDAREWYLKTAADDMWSVKTLDRNPLSFWGLFFLKKGANGLHNFFVSSAVFYRRLKQRDRVAGEMTVRVNESRH